MPFGGILPSSLELLITVSWYFPLEGFAYHLLVFSGPSFSLNFELGEEGKLKDTSLEGEEARIDSFMVLV